jgi:hypothetical protein
MTLIMKKSQAQAAADRRGCKWTIETVSGLVRGWRYNKNES